MPFPLVCFPLIPFLSLVVVNFDLIDSTAGTPSSLKSSLQGLWPSIPTKALKLDRNAAKSCPIVLFVVYLDSEARNMARITESKV